MVSQISRGLVPRRKYLNVHLLSVLEIMNLFTWMLLEVVKIFGSITQQRKEIIAKNMLRLKTIIETARVLALYACAFRGNDESLDSRNRGKFIGLIKYAAILNDKIDEVVLQNAPENAMYTSPKIQKEILHILVDKVRDTIRAEIGDAKLCTLVDEAQDSSIQEQMAIVTRLHLALIGASADEQDVYLFF
ncbi:zinc finger MYM-type protein 1-like isoform X2 [Papaver somniferum]|uniref:zinc finger MYM-type protein 1-like isoform X2 n=1 Tax=Papaver somniferum TaxID=3469 RepID=UPI000E6F8175|nr:zinc finger MYM-type protein 1-like isoform X2 [Papaver somniferum]